MPGILRQNLEPHPMGRIRLVPGLRRSQFQAQGHAARNDRHAVGELRFYPDSHHRTGLGGHRGDRLCQRRGAGHPDRQGAPAASATCFHAHQHGGIQHAGTPGLPLGLSSLAGEQRSLSAVSLRAGLLPGQHVVGGGHYRPDRTETLLAIVDGPPLLDRAELPGRSCHRGAASWPGARLRLAEFSAGSAGSLPDIPVIPALPRPPGGREAARLGGRQPLLARLEEEKRHVSEVASLHLRTIKALALAIDAKDGTTSDHLRRVQVYAMGLAKEMDLDEPETRALEAASLLHDIGKLAVPEHIISKPGRLTPEEFKKMQIHPVVGAEILATVDFPYPVVPIVRAHHERWDGSGYPHGLKGEQIPMGARILAAVDCLDALASDRQYRRALPLDEAMAKVAAEAGTGYDPAVIRVLQRRYLELEALARTSNGAKLANRNVSGRETAPQAGFETASLDNTPGEAQPVEFIASIAAARQEFHMLLEIATGLGSSLCVDDTLSLLARKLQNAIPYHAIAIYIVKDAKLAPQFAEGENSELFGSLEIPLGQGLSGWVAENRKAIINGNPSVEPGYLKDPARFSTLRSALSVPLPGMDGIVGVLTLYHRQAAAFTADHLRILMAVSTKAGLTIENALRYKHAEKSATMDELTLLPNARSLFLHLDAELARCRRTSAELAVMVLDLDGFKEVNDRFGHLTGNRVLKAAAQGIREICRDYDYVARMGGDEFVVLMPGLNRENMPARKIDLHEVVSRTGREICGEEILSVSVGEAFFPADGNDAEQLLTEADRRMYQMKHIHHAQRRARPVLSEPLELQRTEAGGTDVGLAGERRS